jgi:hypothetical protein
MSGRPSINAAHGKRLHLSRLLAELRVVVHYLPHQLLNHLLPDEPILLARQFCACLRDGVDHLVGFVGINFVRRGACRIFGAEIVDQFDHHAVEAGSFFVRSFDWHERFHSWRGGRHFTGRTRGWLRQASADIMRTQPPRNFLLVS